MQLEQTIHRDVTKHKKRRSTGTPLSTLFYPVLYCGCTTVFPSRITAVCAKALPLKDAPV